MPSSSREWERRGGVPPRRLGLEDSPARGRVPSAPPPWGILRDASRDPRESFVESPPTPSGRFPRAQTLPCFREGRAGRAAVGRGGLGSVGPARVPGHSVFLPAPPRLRGGHRGRRQDRAPDRPRGTTGSHPPGRYAAAARRPGGHQTPRAGPGHARDSGGARSPTWASGSEGEASAVASDGSGRPSAARAGGGGTRRLARAGAVPHLRGARCLAMMRRRRTRDSGARKSALLRANPAKAGERRATGLRRPRRHARPGRQRADGVPSAAGGLAFF